MHTVQGDWFAVTEKRSPISTEPCPTTNQALPIFHSTFAPGNPEFLKEEYTRLSTRITSSRGNGSKRGLRIASDNYPAAAPWRTGANGSITQRSIHSLSHASHATSQRLSIVRAQGL